MQFHPTVLYIAGGSRSLITEAVRGEGGWLVDKDGVRFMPQYDPRAELAPRDVVSQAIVSQMEKTRHPCVYLDVTHLDRGVRPQAFPRHRRGLQAVRHRHHPRPDPRAPRRPLHDRRRDRRLTAAKPRFPGCGPPAKSPPAACTAPTAWPRTACSKGSSMALMPARPLRAAALEKDGDYRVFPLENAVVAPPAEPLDLADIRNSLKSLMWRNCGVRRNGERLSRGPRNGRWLAALCPRPPIRRRSKAGSCKTC